MIMWLHHMPPMSHDLYRPFPIISTHFQWFLAISNDFSYWPTSHMHCNPQFNCAAPPEVLQYIRGTSAHKFARMCQQDCFNIELVWCFRHTMEVTWPLNRHCELDMVVLKVELLHKSPVLCTSSKIYWLSAFHFKIFTLYIYSPVHTRK